MTDVPPSYPYPGSKQESWLWGIARGFCTQNLGRVVVIGLWCSSLIYLTKFIPPSPLGQFFLLTVSLLLTYLLWSYSAQTVSEFWLLLAILMVYRGIKARIVGKKLTKTQLLSRYDSVRTNMLLFVTRSGSQLSPVSDILLEKLKPSVDTFFYASGLTVFSEKPDYYSASEERQAELEKEARDEDAELKERFEDALRESGDAFTGHISLFRFPEVTSFIRYLGDRVFRKSGFHAFWVLKYQINLIDYLNFFEHWNELLLKSDNGKVPAASAKTEVREFYDESRRRVEVKAERIWFVVLNLIVLLLSAVIGFVFGRLGLK